MWRVMVEQKQIEGVAAMSNQSPETRVFYRRRAGEDLPLLKQSFVEIDCRGCSWSEGFR
jgi:hypothetical protein